MSLANPRPPFINGIQKVGGAIGSIGLLILFVALFGVALPNTSLWLTASLVLISLGIIIYAHQSYTHSIPGIKNNGVWFSGIAAKGVLGWVTGIVITGFYVLLYWYPQVLGLNEADGNSGLVGLFDPLSYALNQGPWRLPSQ